MRRVRGRGDGERNGERGERVDGEKAGNGRAMERQAVDWGRFRKTKAQGEEWVGQWRGEPEVPMLIPLSRGSARPPRPLLTCLGQEASSTASLGASVLPKLRQDESQATKLLLHLLVGGIVRERGPLTESSLSSPTSPPS